MEVLVVRGRLGGLWCLVVLLALILGACTEEKPPLVKVLRPVRYQAVIITSGERVRTFAGTSKAGEETQLSFKVSGTMRRKPVKVGDTAKRGQLIAELDPADYTQTLNSPAWR